MRATAISRGPRRRPQGGREGSAVDLSGPFFTCLGPLEIAVAAVIA